MSYRVIKSLPQRSPKRHPTRFHAVVEALDTRTLMATGVTGTTLTFLGQAGKPLVPVGYNPTVPYFLIPPPTASLLTLTSSTILLTPVGYTGTINWGDGSPLETAQFSTVADPRSGSPTNQLNVNGLDHIYQTPGNYTISVSVTGPGDSASTVYHDTATIAVALTGQLNPLSDSGAFNNDLLTAITTPNFLGAAAPGATVALSTTSNATGQTLVVGIGVADASGHWSITTVPFADGYYSINASAYDSSGTLLATTPLIDGHFYSNLLQIDTAGPQIEGFQITDAKKGTFEVGFLDRSGLAILPPLDSSHYVVTQTSPAPRKGQTFAVANLTPSFVSGGIPTYGFVATPVLVTGTIVSNKPIGTGNKTITFTIKATAITNIAGVSLDGEYTGKLPAGNGQPGGDFQVKINIRNGKASGPIAITPITPKTTHIVKAKAGVKHHA